MLTVDIADRGPCGGPDDPGSGEGQTFAVLQGELTVEIEAGQALLMAADGNGVDLRERSAPD